MPSDDAKFPADDSQNFATGSRISQDFGFSEKSDGAKDSSTPPPPTWCLLHRNLVRAPLKPGACSTETWCVFN